MKIRTHLSGFVRFNGNRFELRQCGWLSKRAQRSKQETRDGSPLTHRSVLRRPLHVIDDNHLHRALLRFQLQPKLLLERGEKRRAIGIYRGQWRQTGISTTWRRCELAPFRSVLQIDIVLSRQVRFIQDDPSSEARERIHQLRYPDLLAAEMARKHEEPAAESGRQLTRFRRWWRSTGTRRAFALSLM